MSGGKKNIEEMILASARKQFSQKGFAGASLQEIAKEAGTTKSMVNYYYRSKEKLFDSIFLSEFRNLFSSIAGVLMGEAPLEKKLEQIVSLDIDKLLSMPGLPVFILSELHRNPEMIFKGMEHIPVKRLLGQLEKQIKEENKRGIIHYIPARELILNIQAMTIFPFLAKPILTGKLGFTEKSFNSLMQKKKKEVVTMIWNSIKK